MKYYTRCREHVRHERNIMRTLAEEGNSESVDANERTPLLGDAERSINNQDDQDEDDDFLVRLIVNDCYDPISSML